MRELSAISAIFSHQAGYRKHALRGVRHCYRTMSAVFASSQLQVECSRWSSNFRSSVGLSVAQELWRGKNGGGRWVDDDKLAALDSNGGSPAPAELGSGSRSAMRARAKS